MKRFLALLFFGILFFSLNPKATLSQTVDDEVYTKENIPAKKPLTYPSLREADVMWSKKLWQLIDCRKKMNHPLYFPTEKMDDRKSLIQTIMYGIDKEGLTAYQSDEFQEIMTRDEVYQKLGAGQDTIENVLPDGTIEKKAITREIRYDQIKQYLIREQWFFDKKYSRLRVRIVGVAPIRQYIDQDTGEERKVQTFWIYFPEARPILANWEVFNRNNDAQRVSFDDYFHQRRFDSYVTRESNVYGNRRVSTYTTGINTLLEAEKIRNEIFQFEHDLWEY
jgi:gliding motility associated protien GldN